jgi:hypothetical protein
MRGNGGFYFTDTRRHYIVFFFNSFQGKNSAVCLELMAELLVRKGLVISFLLINFQEKLYFLMSLKLTPTPPPPPTHDFFEHFYMA